jgi:predicted RNA-binding Zn ribbon-like protein
MATTGHTPPLQVRSGRLCLDFIGTNGTWLPGEERLVDTGRWREWLAKVQLTPPDVVTDDDLEAVRALRECVHEVIASRTSGRVPPPASIAGVNRAARPHPPAPQLTDEADALLPPAASSHADVLSLIARDLIDLVTGPLADRVRVCANPHCGFYFADSSRPGRRRWCVSCGAAAASARYRDRQRPAGAA